MEFRFNLGDVFKKPIVEVGPTLIPNDYKGDRRGLWDALSKVTDVINAMGTASAAAQNLTRSITTADRLRNSTEQQVYLLIDQEANNGKGAVTGMLKTGKKGLYVFDRDGQHYHVQAPCVLDFYVHESKQRSGYGKKLFEHMLQREDVQPEKLAIDRPSEKFLGFLNKHYTLSNPIRQMNNYVVYDGFFPKTDQSNDKSSPMNNNGESKRGTNGLQAQTVTSPYGRYGAPRPPCSMGQIIHNQSATMPVQEPTGIGEGVSGAQSEYQWPVVAPAETHPDQIICTKRPDEVFQPPAQQEAPVKVPLDVYGRPHYAVVLQNGQYKQQHLMHRQEGKPQTEILRNNTKTRRANTVVDTCTKRDDRFNHFAQRGFNDYDGNAVVLPDEAKYENLIMNQQQRYEQIENYRNAHNHIQNEPYFFNSQHPNQQYNQQYITPNLRVNSTTVLHNPTSHMNNQINAPANINNQFNNQQMHINNQPHLINTPVHMNNQPQLINAPANMNNNQPHFISSYTNVLNQPQLPANINNSSPVNVVTEQPVKVHENNKQFVGNEMGDGLYNQELPQNTQQEQLVQNDTQGEPIVNQQRVNEEHTQKVAHHDQIAGVHQNANQQNVQKVAQEVLRNQAETQGGYYQGEIQQYNQQNNQKDQYRREYYQPGKSQLRNSQEYIQAFQNNGPVQDNREHVNQQAQAVNYQQGLQQQQQYAPIEHLNVEHQQQYLQQHQNMQMNPSPSHQQNIEKQAQSPEQQKQQVLRQAANAIQPQTHQNTQVIRNDQQQSNNAQQPMIQQHKQPIQQEHLQPQQLQQRQPQQLQQIQPQQLQQQRQPQHVQYSQDVQHSQHIQQPQHVQHHQNEHQPQLIQQQPQQLLHRQQQPQMIQQEHEQKPQMPQQPSHELQQQQQQKQLPQQMYNYQQNPNNIPAQQEILQHQQQQQLLQTPYQQEQVNVNYQQGTNGVDSRRPSVYQQDANGVDSRRPSVYQNDPQDVNNQLVDYPQQNHQRVQEVKYQQKEMNQQDVNNNNQVMENQHANSVVHEQQFIDPLMPVQTGQSRYQQEIPSVHQKTQYYEQSKRVQNPNQKAQYYENEQAKQQNRMQYQNDIAQYYKEEQYAGMSNQKGQAYQSDESKQYSRMQKPNANAQYYEGEESKQSNGIQDQNAGYYESEQSRHQLQKPQESAGRVNQTDQTKVEYQKPPEMHSYGDFPRDSLPILMGKRSSNGLQFETVSQNESSFIKVFGPEEPLLPADQKLPMNYKPRFSNPNEFLNEQQEKKRLSSVHPLQRNMMRAKSHVQNSRNYERQNLIYGGEQSKKSIYSDVPSKLSNSGAQTPARAPVAAATPPPKLDRPQTLSLHADHNNRPPPPPQIVNDYAVDDDDDELSELVDHVENDFMKVEISPSSRKPDAHEEEQPARKTPSHLTEQGYFDLKFYHNKLW